MAVKGFVFAVISLASMVALFMNIIPFLEVASNLKEHAVTNEDNENDH